jgi:hypothetical protein
MATGKNSRLQRAVFYLRVWNLSRLMIKDLKGFSTETASYLVNLSGENSIGSEKRDF